MTPTVPPLKHADLHLHTHFSDGTWSPEELAGHARRQGLDAIALTDHDSVDGCPRMAEACAHEGLEFIPGTELTADVEGQEIHVLGYWIDALDPVFLAELGRFQTVRQRRIRDMVSNLNAAGVGLREEAVLELAQCGSPGRLHVARALVAGGFANDHDQAFDRFLKKGRAGYVPKARMTAADAVQLIHRAGGVAVLAHPGLYRNDGLIPKLRSVGLDGLECWHTRHSAEAANRYTHRASELHLVATGGSDCHGMAKGQPLIGQVKLPYSQVEQLRARRPAPSR
jgi:3',5'-nucleoside bisphosphate phosphatase